ncbi:unnamed protein product [Blepharisma stoltei]|uniref:Uncharacterized protein n=1 Tax=Blepharisma stoltei TaxID=1481888 RepID=A0AAU9KD51_9CILI|nr:unnamed protein product [Blepharisma stoltei]
MNSESRPLINRTTRQSCFICKRSLDSKPYANMILYVLLGILILCHIWGSLILLYLKVANDIGEYFTLFLPVVLLCVEICIICITVFIIILSDFITRKVRGITLWQRQAIGRLIRDFVIFLQLGLTAWFFYAGFDDNSLKSPLWHLLMPGIVLSVLASLRFVLIQSEDSLFWICFSFLTIAQQILCIWKIDYKAELSWIYCLIPTYLMCADFAWLSASYFLRFAKELDYSKMIIFLLGIIGSIFSGIGMFFISFYLEDMIEFNSAIIWIGIGLGISSIPLIRPFGLFIIDIAVGHIEIEILQLKYPVRSIRNLPHSV